MQRQLKNLKFLHKGTIKCQCFASLGTKGIDENWCVSRIHLLLAYLDRANKILSILFEECSGEKYEEELSETLIFNLNNHKTPVMAGGFK